MTTANDIVEAAWRRITVSASEESINAAEAADLLEILNDYLSTLKARGASYTHYALILANTIQTPPELDGPLKTVLAWKGCEHFGKPIPPGLAIEGEKGDNFILGVMMVPVDLTVEEGLRDPLTSSRYDVDLG